MLHEYPIRIISTSIMAEEVVIVKKRNANTLWNKESNGFIISEVLVGHPTRIANYAELKHCQQTKFWEQVSAALKERPQSFPTTLSLATRSAVSTELFGNDWGLSLRAALTSSQNFVC